MTAPPPRPGKYRGLALPDGGPSPVAACILAAVIAGGLWAWTLAVLAVLAAR